MCSRPENTRPLEQNKNKKLERVKSVLDSYVGMGGGLCPTHKHPVAIRNKIAQKCTKRFNVMVEILAYKRGCGTKNAQSGNWLRDVSSV
jgi:hypothetical protein